MELYLIRHGETESNKEKRYQGWTESPLSAHGLRQAEKAGLFLGGKNVEKVFCSDLNRALHTARVVGACCGLRPEVTPLLREIHFGRWEGLTFDEIEASWEKEIRRWLDDPFIRSAPGGETIEQVRKRMLSFVEAVTVNYPHCRRIAAVSHGGAIRALLHHLLGLDLEGFWHLKIDNASISLIRREEEQHSIIYYNRVDHLAAGEREEFSSGV